METSHAFTRDPLPIFISGPDQTDILFSAVVVLFIASLFGIGIFYLRIHSLPDKIAHAGGKIQLQIVSILCLISLFTHNHFYWIAALLLAFMEFPDFLSPIKSMARSLKKIANQELKTDASAPITASPNKTDSAPIIAETFPSYQLTPPPVSSSVEEILAEAHDILKKSKE